MSDDSDEISFYDLPLVQVLYRSSAALSIFGSSWIIIEIIHNRKKRNTCYHRLLFALSLFDLLASIGFFAGGWAQTKTGWLAEAPDNQTALGNVATCHASGFVIFMGSLAIPWYNAALSVYYYLSVCQGWREQKMKKSFEQYVHIMIVPTVIILAVFPLVLRIYNPLHFYCFISGGDQSWYFWFFFSLFIISVLICSAIIITTMISIGNYVRKTTNRSESYSFRGVGVEPGRQRRRQKL